MTERDVCLVSLGGKMRPAVVLFTYPGGAWVIALTGTYRPHIDHIAVEPGAREGKALGLSKPSYFYRANFVAAPEDQLQRGTARCPPALYARLVAFVGGRPA